ncbi:hypothetical protein H5410_000790 [Solanum commersonii]|uniref:RNase H type-1 domain-containing protein n=1 Tax=Solanum commersonii TaxID=4109 RepID=A0A9J6AXG8_SOLCO|nr:hypothetical protein H5410_000790 [Solanum commersonii]
MNVNKKVSLGGRVRGLAPYLLPLIGRNPDWESVRYLLISNISIVQVKWLKPSNSFVKINSDGSCKDGYCGGGGVIRDHRGHLIH